MSPAATKKPRARRKKTTAAELRVALKDQPLVGLVGAAHILGVKPPNITRLRRQGRMPDGVQVEGSAMVYVRSEVVALAKALERERNGR